MASLLLGCTSKVAFRATDASFVPSHGSARPPVYLDASRVPAFAFRSVGLVEVVSRSSADTDVAIDAAAAKGESLGCWALIDHSVFLGLQSRATGGNGSARGGLEAHEDGAHPTGSVPRAASARPYTSLQLDCVVKIQPVNAGH